MGDRGVGVTDQAPAAGVAEVRTRERSIGGNTYAEQYVIPIRERVPTFIGMVPTFRMVGTAAAAPHWLLSIEHASGSGKLVLVRQLTYYQDETAATTAVNVIANVARATGTPGGGTVLTKTSVGTGEDAAQTSASQLTIRGGASADGTNAAITGLTMANRMWRAFGARMHTTAGASHGFPKDLVPPAMRDHGIVLRPGENLAVALEYAAAADNPATFHHVVNLLWEEYTLP